MLQVQTILNIIFQAGAVIESQLDPNGKQMKAANRNFTLHGGKLFKQLNN